jgi:hypothetical protein
MADGISAKAGRYRRGRAVSKGLSAAAAALAIGGLTILVGAASASAAGNMNLTITVTPSTGLSDGASVTITGSGFAPTSIGNVLECNSDAKQPNVALGSPVNSSISVSCTAPSLTKLVTTTSSGSVSTTFKVVQGTVGPPCGPTPAVVTCPATDTGGQSPTADAALYPCPPTAAQQAIGDVCTLSYGDQANDSGTATILFAGETPPAATTTTAATTPTTAAAAPTTTRAPATAPTSVTTSAAPAAPTPGVLASTGPGRGVGWLGAIGAVLLLFGLLLLLLMNAPRRALAGLIPLRSRTMSAPVDDRHTPSLSQHMAEATSKWVGRVDHLGRRLGDQVSGAPAAARGVAHKTVSASTRTARWFLGR